MAETDQSPPNGSVDKAEDAVAEKSPSSSVCSSSEMDLAAVKQDAKAEAAGNQITRTNLINTLLICLLQLLNFMERYSLPGMLV